MIVENMCITFRMSQIIVRKQRKPLSIEYRASVKLLKLGLELSNKLLKTRRIIIIFQVEMWLEKSLVLS